MLCILEDTDLGVTDEMKHNVQFRAKISCVIKPEPYFNLYTCA